MAHTRAPTPTPAPRDPTTCTGGRPGTAPCRPGTDRPPARTVLQVMGRLLLVMGLLLAMALPLATGHHPAMAFLLLGTAHLLVTVHLLVTDPHPGTGLPPAMAPLPQATDSLPMGPRTLATDRSAYIGRTHPAHPVRCLLLQAHTDHQTLASQAPADHSLYSAVWLLV